MSGLATRLEELALKLKAIEKVRSDQHLADDLKDAVQKLIQEAAPVCAAIQSHFALSKRKLKASSRVDVGVLKKCVAEIRKVAEETPEKVKNARRFKDLLDELATSEAGLSDENLAAWTAYREKVRPPVSLELFQLLADAGKGQKELDRIRRFVGEVDSFPIPTCVEQVDQFGKLIEQLKSASASFPYQLPEDPEVKTFLLAAHRGIGALAQLTPKVVKWIEANKLEESFVVRFR